VPDPVWDPAGKARAALASIVSDFGTRALSSPSILDNALHDLLPDSPKQVSLIVAAGGSTVASSLKEHVGQGMDPDTAVRLASTQLAEQTPYDAAGCRWVTGEFARALGYQVSDAPAGVDAPAPNAPPTAVVPPSDAVALPSIMPTPPAAALRPDQAPTILPPHQPAPADPIQGLPIQPAQPVPPPPWEVAAPAAHAPAAAPRRRSRKVPILIAIVVVIGGLAIIGAVSKTPAATPIALKKLLPSGTSECVTKFSTFSGLQGVVTKLGCNETAIDGAVFAYQFDSSADYQASLAAFNKEYRFDPSTASSGCPTKAEDGKGITTWHSKLYPSNSGQVLECFYVTFAQSKNTLQPSYAWTAPSENAIFQAVGGKQTSMNAVDTWWGNHGGPFDK
jgi:hypothetical protein